MPHTKKWTNYQNYTHLPDLDCFLLYEWLKIALIQPTELRRVVLFAMNDPVLHLFFNPDENDTSFLTGKYRDELYSFVDDFPSFFQKDSELIDEDTWASMHNIKKVGDELNSIPRKLFSTSEDF